MNKLNEKIVDILKQHPEGKDFFNALDAMIRGDLNILSTFVDFAIGNITNPKSYVLVLTGRFGIALINNFGTYLNGLFSQVILVNGGIREGNVPTILAENLNSQYCIMFDDSFYSGKTRDTINSKLNELHANIVETYVVYDGSITKDRNVFSMFRYHPEPSAVDAEFPGINEDDLEDFISSL